LAGRAALPRRRVSWPRSSAALPLAHNFGAGRGPGPLIGAAFGLCVALGVELRMLDIPCKLLSTVILHPLANLATLLHKPDFR